MRDGIHDQFSKVYCIECATKFCHKHELVTLDLFLCLPILLPVTFLKGSVRQYLRFSYGLYTCMYHTPFDKMSFIFFYLRMSCWKDGNSNADKGNQLHMKSQST